MKPVDVLLICLIAAAVVCAVVSVLRRRKKDGGGCGNCIGGNCEACKTRLERGKNGKRG